MTAPDTSPATVANDDMLNGAARAIVKAVQVGSR